MSNRTQSIAAYMFYVWDKEEDVNRPITAEETQWYRDCAQRFLDATTDLFLLLPNVERDEVEIQALMYDIGKRYYGAGKDQLNFWFKNIYTVMFGKEVGPRIGVFICLFGIDEFLDKLEKQIDNPFGFKV